MQASNPPEKTRRPPHPGRTGLPVNSRAPRSSSSPFILPQHEMPGAPAQYLDEVFLHSVSGSLLQATYNLLSVFYQTELPSEKALGFNSVHIWCCFPKKHGMLSDESKLISLKQKLNLTAQKALPSHKPASAPYLSPGFRQPCLTSLH